MRTPQQIGFVGLGKMGFPMAGRLAAAGFAENSGIQDASNLWENLAYYLYCIADYKGAKATIERALKISEATCGSEHPDVARNFTALGMVLDDRLENHLRGIADLPLKDTQQPSRIKASPASDTQKPQQQKSPEPEEEGEGAGEEVAA